MATTIYRCTVNGSLDVLWSSVHKHTCVKFSRGLCVSTEKCCHRFHRPFDDKNYTIGSDIHDGREHQPPR